MYVCICNRYRDSAIREAAGKNGHRDAPALYEALGCGAKCGRCLELAQDLIDDVHAQATQAA